MDDSGRSNRLSWIRVLKREFRKKNKKKIEKKYKKLLDILSILIV